MLELPEIKNLGDQMRKILPGKEITDLDFRRVAKLEEWGMITQRDEEFKEKLLGTRILEIVDNPWFVYLRLDNNYALAIGELDGKVVYHEQKDDPPGILNLRLYFSDKTKLTVYVKLWGVIKVFTEEQLKDHNAHYNEMSISPVSDSFTPEHMISYITENEELKKLNVKKFITTKTYVNGLGNGYLQEILYRAKIHPRTKVGKLTEQELKKFQIAIAQVTREGITLNGRINQYDLFNQTGKFVSGVNKDTVGTKCNECGSIIDKMSFEGGTCYFCPGCQVEK